MDTNDKKNESADNKFDLVNGTFKSATTNISVVKFEAQDGKEEQHRLAVEVKFLEGPNAERVSTFLCGTQNIEFFTKVLIAIGWKEGTNPLDTPVGYELSAVVDTDTNPRTNKKRNQIKYLNAIGGGSGGMGKYRMEKPAATAWIRGPMTQVMAFIKSTGTVIPKPNAVVAPTTSVPSGASKPGGGGAGNSAHEDDVPFIREARGEEI